MASYPSGRPPLRLARQDDPDDESEQSPYPKASLFLRGMARAMDLAAAYGIFVLGGRAGAVLSILFVLFSDGVLQGQSVGKRIFGIKVMHLPTRSVARSRDSVLRNASLALPVLFGMMPSPLGLRAFLGAALVIGGLEAFQVWRHPLGLRWGDAWAQTQVVDGKDVSASAVGERVTAEPAAQPSQMRVASRSKEKACALL